MNLSHIAVSQRDQQGASLMIVMILLLVMTLLGLAVMRSALLEERMSANLLDRSYSFQAAEAALREGEALAAQPNIQATVPASGCTNGLCSLPNASVADRWLNISAGDWRPATAANASGNAAPSTFIVEYMGEAPTWPGCDLVDETNRSPLCMRPRFRITARSEADDRASVMLQSNYIAL
jgi:type IV pilus assembly protein PilX